MTMMDDAGDAVTEDVPDSVELLQTGRVRLTIDGRVYTLRLPKHGEFKQLRLGVSGLPVDATTEEHLDAMVNWVRDVFKLLSDKQLGDNEDDWPAWLMSGQLASRLLLHWRDVPLALGGLPIK